MYEFHRLTSGVSMNIHYLQHGASEGVGRIADWARARGLTLPGSHLYRGEKFPAVDSVDFLIIMGGEMNIYQHRDHPWLVEEKRFIKAAIEQGKVVLGICLGAQLIADALGAKIYQNPEIEIGWFPVRFAGSAKEHAPFRSFPPELTALHWHGDTFDLPPNAVRLAGSAGCENQGFLYKERVAALQFHLEVGRQEVELFLGGGGEIGSGRFIQTAAAIRNCDRYLPATEKTLWSMLDGLASINGPRGAGDIRP